MIFRIDKKGSKKPKTTPHDKNPTPPNLIPHEPLLFCLKLSLSSHTTPNIYTSSYTISNATTLTFTLTPSYVR